jgi:hypothetical protein
MIGRLHLSLVFMKEISIPATRSGHGVGPINVSGRLVWRIAAQHAVCCDPTLAFICTIPVIVTPSFLLINSLRRL